VFSAGDAGKVKRLRRSPRARVAACDVRGHIVGGWRDATARLVSDPSSLERGWVALKAKYGWQMRLADLLSQLAGRLNRRAWIEIDIQRDSTPARPGTAGPMRGGASPGS